MNQSPGRPKAGSLPSGGTTRSEKYTYIFRPQRLNLVLGCLLWLWLALVQAAAAAVAIDAHTPWPLHLLDTAEVLEDVDGTLTLAEVAALPAGQRGGWLAAAEARTAPGTNESVWWLRTTLRNDGAQPLALTLTPGSPRLGAVAYHLLLPGAASSDIHVPINEPGQRRQRYELLTLSLAPGESVDVLLRVHNVKAVAVRPKLYSDQAFEARERRAALWNGALLGGLGALAWSALAIAALARSWPFLWLGLLSAMIGVSEFVKRGYPREYLEPSALLMDERVQLALLPIVGMMLIAFFLQLGQREGVRIPGHKWYVGLMALAVVRLMVIFFGPLPLAYRLATLGWALLAVSMVISAVVLLLRRAPGARIILAAMIVGLLNNGLAVAITQGATVLPWLDMDLEPHPVSALAHLAGNLAIMAAWIHYVGRQRNQAREQLAEQQHSEQARLRREVELRTAELNEALAYAEAQNRQKVEMLGYITHDLRAPLATISGYTRLLAASQTPGQEPHIQAMERSVGYQMALIDELLEYARGELTPLAVQPAPVDLSQLLEEVAGFAAALGARQGNRVVYEPPAMLPRLVSLDGRRVQQVLLNLLSNAAKFTHRGTITLALRAAPAADGWRLDFSVADTGIGIDLAEHSAVFDAFRQIQRSQGGVGLGLFIAQNIVRALGGELRVDSSLGHGSRFGFALVVAVIDATPVHPERLAQMPPCALPEPAPAAAPVEVGECLHLATLAREGRLTDIEEWLDAMAGAGTGHEAFLAQVRQLLQMLDFEGIATLALASRTVVAEDDNRVPG